MILAENRCGHQLLEYIQVSEEDLIQSDVFKPVTGSFAFIKCDGKYLIAYNKWRNQWEFPAGKIEEGETYKECAIRELFEETNQQVSNLEYRGAFKICDINKGQVRYRAAYFAEIDKITEFKENEEMNKIMLWDLESDIGYFDEVDKKMLQIIKMKL